MPLIARSDGIQFVLQPYRELIEFSRKSMLIPKVQMLSERQGQFVRLFKKSADQMEGVFSKEPGYLFGEAVSQHFGRLQNLIFCEQLPDEHVFLVIVRNGIVYLDAKIGIEQIQSELMPILVTGEQFHIFISGKDLPFSQKAEAGKITFPEASVLSFANLEEPLFPRLVVNESFRLQPVSMALKSAQLTQIPTVVWGIAISVVAIILIATVVHKSRVASEIPVIKAAMVSTPKVYPYQQYYTALKSPAPLQVLQEFTALVNSLSFIPGWPLNLVSYSAAQYQVQLTNNEAPIALLNQWANEHDFSLEVNSTGIQLYKNSLLQDRSKPEQIYNAEQVVKLLMDRLTPLLGSDAISLSPSLMHNASQEIPISLNLTTVSPQFLLLLGQELKGLPISLTSFSFAVRDDLMSGTIKLSVWGS